jgi:hypothetical protein
MPGAPNKPPELAATSPAAAGPEEARRRQVLRRLGPARAVLRLEVFRGAPHPDLVKPVERAESLFVASDFLNADLALDQFAVRLAEPRWPTLPEPFRRLRVEIARPQPPHWDPDHALSAAEKDTKKARGFAELQLLVATACVERGPSLGADLASFGPALDGARRLLESEGATDAFWAPIDELWSAVRDRIALPASAATRPVPAAPLPPGIQPDPS